MIGKAAKPRCFKNVQSLPVEYAANKKAWMTNDLFKNYLLKFDKDMIKQNRKIILFIDNCSAHNDLPSLKNINVKFLPPNTTSKLQPLDAGIIQNFKVFYRKEVVHKLLLDIEKGKKDPVDVLQAIRFSHKAWAKVSQSTIFNCFRSSGFEKNNNPILVSNDNSYEIPGFENETWHHVCNENINFDDYVRIDECVSVCGKISDHDIVDSVVQKDEDKHDNSDEESDQNKRPIIGSKQAKISLDDVRTFIESFPNVSDEIFFAIDKVENFVDKNIDFKLKKQLKMTNFLRHQ